MNATDYMIRDWILVDKKPIQIKQVCENCIISDFGDGDEEVDCFEPIPLTPEILEKNGFEHGNECEKNEFIGITKEFEYCILGTIDGYNCCFDAHLTISGNIKYVHELQHALKLCGINKEIVL